MAECTVDILAEVLQEPNRPKPRQSLLYEFGELSGPYPLYSSLLSNHAAQQQKETLMLKKRGMDM